jgi:hypothetical protein
MPKTQVCFRSRGEEAGARYENWENTEPEEAVLVHYLSFIFCHLDYLA